MSVIQSVFRLLCVLVLLLTTTASGLHGCNNTLSHEYCVLGAGPAGLQMGYFLSRSQRDYIILERNAGPGSFFNIYPRHRKLISINKIHTGRRNKEFNLRHDWNSLLSDRPDLLFQRISQELYPSADDFPRYLSVFEKELGLKVIYGADVGRIKASDFNGHQGYVLTDQNGLSYECRVLLVSTGLWVPQQVGFRGSDLVEGYESIPTDPEEFKDQAVLILGKGNSAFETAQSILGRASRIHLYSPSPVRLAWQTHYVGDLRAVNNELLDTYQLKSLDGLVEGRLEDIAIVRREKNGKRRAAKKRNPTSTKKNESLYLTLTELLDDHNGTNKVTGQNLPGYHTDNFSLRQPYDRVIRCLGFRFNFSIFDGSARPPQSSGARGRLPGVTAWYEGRGTPNMFVLGTAAHSRDYRMSAGGFIHGFRYTVRAVYKFLEQRYHNIAWPTTNLPISQLQSWILRRVNEASGTYQMFGVLGDIILLQGSHCKYLEEFPLQALPQLSALSGHSVSDHGLLVLVMQYGLNQTDTLGPGRAESEWTKAWKSNFLHPVLYYYKTLPTDKDMRQRPVGWPLPRPEAVHHMVEDFLTEWDQPISHSQPLRRFLEHCLQTDLRAFYAESCFLLSLTSGNPPLFCHQGYLRKQGIVGNRHLWQHAREAGLMADAALSEDASVTEYLNHAGAAVISTVNFDL
ncbi:FAD-dependent oxidoreductase domain-containing protein 2 [Danio aesculapii]|uniref:FAD-dependent oxidoreductase domain-containing protein 2 n=1 Tax=Danio aesculapii TaxID=1142201 RepID=UPI0024BF7C45|nr:FAD-dependent oxidoreductase domain-containing protein 2 [Danio aesculapii]XP_056309458.1 FAD-dependent oxidoreductase domain-containing protein 2 [Danio aesculapii]